MIARHKLQDAAQPAEVTIERKDATEPRLILDPPPDRRGESFPVTTNIESAIKSPIARPRAGAAATVRARATAISDDEDTFRFVLSRTEYLNLLFDDLELPALIKKDLLEIDENRFRRGGVQRYGNPGSVCVARTFKASIGRGWLRRRSTRRTWRKPRPALIAARGPGIRCFSWRPERALADVSGAPARSRFLTPTNLRTEVEGSGTGSRRCAETSASARQPPGEAPDSRPARAISAPGFRHVLRVLRLRSHPPPMEA